MARVIGVDLPSNKRLEIALTYIYGIGRTSAMKVCKELGLDPGLKARDLTEEQITTLATHIQKEYTVEGNLRHVNYLSNPIPEEDMNYIETETPGVVQAAINQADSGAMCDGAVPVPVSLPLEGWDVDFEKLLALDETLTISFDYRGLKKR